MKNLFKSTKTWTILSALTVIVTCGSVLALGSREEFKFSESNFDTSTLWNVLTSEQRDHLMYLLDEWTVPRWAILAFDRTDGCPEWWIRYSQADGRFLMGASSGIWATWWQNSIYLSVSQIPEHYHNLFADATATDYGYDKKWKPYKFLNYSVLWENKHDSWDGNYSYTMWTTKDNKEPNIWRTGKTWNGNPINITNSYVKVIYCKKI